MNNNGHQNSQNSIRVVGVQRSFGEGDQRVSVLRGVDLVVPSGQLVALYGPSGSGKTTLLNLIGGLDYPDRGEIYIEGQNIVDLPASARARLRRTRIGFIFQTDSLLPTYTVMENIDMALRLPHLTYFERRRRAKTTLAAVGMSAWADHLPEELSGGQRRRVAIARALALRPAVILADEPTSGLDTPTARRFLALFRSFAQQEGTTFLIVSHDPLVADFVDTAYNLEGGQLYPRQHQLQQGDNGYVNH
jgi:ABC-type lipoprotein export system ATPase subunit